MKTKVIKIVFIVAVLALIVSTAFQVESLALMRWLWIGVVAVLLGLLYWQSTEVEVQRAAKHRFRDEAADHMDALLLVKDNRDLLIKSLMNITRIDQTKRLFIRDHNEQERHFCIIGGWWCEIEQHHDRWRTIDDRVREEEITSLLRTCSEALVLNRT